jgi:hypothetical protein
MRIRFQPVLIFLITIALILGCNTDASDQHRTLVISDTEIKVIENIGSESKVILFFNMHEDEKTSIEAMKSFNTHTPINYIYLEHSGQRRIQFKLSKTDYSIDPNRIFTQAGRKMTLEDGGNQSKNSETLVWKFAEQLLDYVKDYDAIVAMHNNTADNYSINSYLPDSSEAQNTAQLYINPKMDPDDFIYTTDEFVYNELIKQEINVILQDNTNFNDDGSLSIYCGLHKIRYVNIETEHGHLEKQVGLMKIIQKILK